MCYVTAVHLPLVNGMLWRIYNYMTQGLCQCSSGQFLVLKYSYIAVGTLQRESRPVVLLLQPSVSLHGENLETSASKPRLKARRPQSPEAPEPGGCSLDWSGLCGVALGQMNNFPCVV